MSKPSRHWGPVTKSKHKKVPKLPSSDRRRHSRSPIEGDKKRRSRRKPPRGRHKKTRTSRSRSPGPRSGESHSKGRSGRSSRRCRKGVWKNRTKKRPKGMRKSEWIWIQQKREKKRKKNYTKYRWYWGVILPGEAERHLNDIPNVRSGTFILRSNLFQETTTLYITVLTLGDPGKIENNKFSHIRLITKRSKWQLENYKTRHKTIIDLVKYYRNHRIGQNGPRLKHAARQPDWLLRSYHILAPENAKKLGNGAFGCVVIGAYARRLVAVKKLIIKKKKDEEDEKKEGKKEGKKEEKKKKNKKEEEEEERLFLRDRELLMQEAAIMKKLEHPYITKLIGISVDKLPPMVVVEIMAGALDSFIKLHGKDTSFEEKLLYCLHMSKGLAYMASQNIVHRDLAARNALISRYGIVKIADFGLAGLEKDLKNVNSAKEHLPIAWAAPECLKDISNATFNEKTDVWGFAVTCNEIFHNGTRPLSHVAEDRRIPEIVAQGNALYIRCKGIPPEVIDYLFDSCMHYDSSQRPPFAEIATMLEMWVKLKYFPPPPDQQMLCKLRHCHPLTMAEYELLYANNLDWVPPVRRGKHKKPEKKKQLSKKRKREAKIAKLKKKNPKKVLKKLRRRLRKRRLRMMMRKKLRLMRRIRTEERTRVRLLREVEVVQQQKKHYSQAPGKKKIRRKFVKLVALYRRLMRVKYRKRAPNRKTRLRLRPARLINKKSKHAASRNGKAIRVITRGLRIKKAPFPKPVFPRIKKLAKRPMKVKKPKGNKREVLKKLIKGKRMIMKKKRKERLLAVLEKRKELAMVKFKKRKEEKTVSKNPPNAEQRKKLKKKLKKRRKKKRKKRKRMRKKRKKKMRRKRRKRRHRRMRKRHRRRNRKRHRRNRRVRRRRVRRRRYRRKKQEIRLRALTNSQKARMDELEKRRRDKLRQKHRRRRREKIARILKRWRLMRRLMLKKKLKLIMRRKKRQVERLKRKREKLRKKKIRKLKRLQKKKAKQVKKLQKEKGNSKEKIKTEPATTPVLQKRKKTEREKQRKEKKARKK